MQAQISFSSFLGMLVFSSLGYGCQEAGRIGPESLDESFVVLTFMYNILSGSRIE